MSLVKSAQMDLDLDGISVEADDLNDLRLDLEMMPESLEEEDFFSDGGEISGEINIEVGDDDVVHKEFSFTLPHVPGGDDQTEIVEPEEIEVEEPEEDIEVSNDPWKWKINSFMDWLQAKINNVPRHSGRDTTGLERAIAYLETLNREISKAVRMDIDNVLDVDSIEKAREEIHRGIERLEERLDKVKSTKYPGKNKKKKAEGESEGLVKEAQKAASFTINVPLFISHIARVCINSMVSAGHDIEQSFKKLAKKYDLSKREQVEVMQLLQDMGYPVRRDRGFALDEDIDTTSSDNFDWAANYPA
jgi:hypothetical protein